MACFLVSAAEAAAVTAAQKHIERKEKNEQTSDIRIPLSRKLKWLTRLLWGGAALLAFEHVWHGEVAPWFPFLTAMENPADAAEMFHEMATVGVCMAALITVIWIGLCLTADAIVKRPDPLSAQGAV